MENCIGPSKLHLKRKLTVLSRSKLLRDPETHPSWRSPWRPRFEVVTTNCLSHAHENRRNKKLAYKASGILEIEQKSALPSQSGYRRKPTYLYNWGHRSTKSSASGIKLNGDTIKESAHDCADDILNNHHEVLKNPAFVLYSKGTKSETPLRRKARKVPMHATPKQPVVRKLEKTRFLDLPYSSLEFLNLVEPSDDTKYCDSEELQHKMQELIGTGHVSHAETPLLSASGSTNWLSSHECPKYRGREESSCSLTPLSAASQNRHGEQKLVGASWDGTGEALQGDTMYLPGSQECGISCYSSKRKKDRGCKGWYSPSLSDKLRRTGGSFICGSQIGNHKRRQSNIYKIKNRSKSIQVLPLPNSSYDGGSSSTETASDEILTRFGELEMEALNQLDRMGWSNCRSQEGVEVKSPVPSCGNLHHKNRSLDWRYKPRFFEEIIGQNIVVQSLKNAIIKGRIAPAYLFHGPRGTGKSYCARIFAAALNCLSIEDQKPCGICRECTEFNSGHGSSLKELDASDEKGVDKVRHLLKSLPNASPSMHYSVIVIDHCHMISSKTWSAFIKVLEEPPSRFVFVFITVEPNKLPNAVVSRCQRYLFSKVREVDMVSRLRNLSAEEGLDAEVEALHLIAVNSDGSMRDAEIMLNQLSSLGRRITTSLVNDLVGVASDEKLVDLLEIAMSSDTAETLRRARELLDSGISPMTLMTQLATLIMDIIAGTNRLSNSNSSDSILQGQSLNEAELGRLHQALKILSEYMTQIRHSSECSTWFTTALLQLGSGSSAEPPFSSGRSSNSTKKILHTCTSNLIEDPLAHEKLKVSLKLQGASSSSIPKLLNDHSNPHINPSSTVLTNENMVLKNFLGCISPDMLNRIWRSCIKGCHSKTLRNLLSTDGKLVSLTDVGGELIACIAFGNATNKSRAERFLSSITNSLETVLKHNVKVRIDLLADNSLNRLDHSSTQNQLEERMLSKDRQVETTTLKFSSNQFQLDMSQPRSGEYCEDVLQRTGDKGEGSHEPDESSEKANPYILSSTEKGVHGSNESRQEFTRKELEYAWLQAVERGRLGSVNCLNSEVKQILPQDGIGHQKSSGSDDNMINAISSKHWEDELNYEIRTLKAEGCWNDKNSGRVNRQVVSPSILHAHKLSACFDEDNEADDPGTGCNGLLCWKTKRSHREKGKQGNIARTRKTSGLSWLSNGKSTATRNRCRFGT